MSSAVCKVSFLFVIVLSSLWNNKWFSEKTSNSFRKGKVKSIQNSVVDSKKYHPVCREHDILSVTIRNNYVH